MAYMLHKCKKTAVYTQVNGNFTCR